MEVLKPVLDVITACATGLAAYFTFRAAEFARHSAEASEKSAKTARDTMDLSQTPSLVIKRSSPTLVLEWFIEAAQPHDRPQFTLSRDVGLASLSIVNAGAGFAFNTKLKIRMVGAPPFEDGAYQFGGPGTATEMNVAQLQGWLVRDWLHKPGSGAREQMSGENLIVASPEFGAPRTEEALCLPREFVTDIAFNALKMLGRDEDQFSLDGKVVRAIEARATCNDVAARPRESDWSRFELKIAGLDLIDASGHSVLEGRDNFESLATPRPPVFPWVRARITFAVEPVEGTLV